ncbi:MAG: hypothetical protein LBI99_10685, partial [Propionibacteriaceae bacterium]|nr:hypothetical protein [Propionibacteriaceae bacterium]
MTVAELIQSPEQPKVYRMIVAWLGVLALMSIVVGALVSLFWASVVSLPEYRILTDGSAYVSERGLVEFVTADAWYVLCAVLVGPGIGYVAWRWFKPVGWPVALVAAAAGLLTGVICWWCGGLFGPGDLDFRLAAAQPGDLIPIALDLQARSALFVWPFAAVAPVLVISGFS